MRAIREAAAACETDCRVVAEECALPLGLPGSHQRQNAALALAALRALPHFEYTDEAVARGLAATRWPGRFDEVRPGVVMDGAHNPHAMRTLVACWRERFGSAKAHCIFAGSADKDLDTVLGLLAPIVCDWALPPVQSPRILPPAELLPKVRAAGATNISTPPTLAAALEHTPTPTLICGSFFLLGEAMALMRGSAYRQTIQ